MNLQQQIDDAKKRVEEKYGKDPDVTELLRLVGIMQTSFSYWKEEALSSHVEEFPNER